MISAAALILGWLLITAAKPFPHWPTFFRVLGQILGNWRLRGVTPRQRLRQLWSLTSRHVLLGPLWTVLWWLDELLYPAYRRVPIVAPIFVISQPRSGTTLLHRALAEHDQLIALRTYEWQFPFITVQRLLGWLDTVTGGRVARIDHFRGDVGGAAARMHRQRLGDYEEDGIFFEHVALVHLFTVLRFPWPVLFDAMDRVDLLSDAARRRLLDTHACSIRKVLWRRGAGRTVVLKENESWLRQEDWLRRYPDARYLTVMRPVETWMPSLLQLTRHSTVAKTGVDPWRLDGWAEALIAVKQRDTERMASFFDEVLRESGNLQLRIDFDALVADPEPVLENVAMQLGVRVTPIFRAALERLAAAQKRRVIDGESSDIALDPQVSAVWQNRMASFALFESFRSGETPLPAPEAKV